MLTKTPYYKFKERDVSNSLDENLTEFTERFNDAIALHLRSDVEVGSCLSGGLDSSAIVLGASQELKSSQLQTFTAAYKDPQIDESAYAQKVS